MIKKQIPNLLTLCNLTCGALAAYMAAMGRLHIAAIFIFCGILFDFFDGFAARLLGVASPMGKELDSLADVVTSGVAPAFILFRILFCFHGWKYWVFLAFLMPAFAGYRLAKFNLDERQHTSFLGLPVPSNALIWASLGLCVVRPEWAQVAILPVPAIQHVLLSNTTLIIMGALSMLTNILMISEVPMLSLKFHSFGWRGNEIKYILLIGAVLLIALFGIFGIAIAILWYILLSLLCGRRQCSKS